MYACNVRAITKDNIPLVVKYCTAVYPAEAEVMIYVSSRTSVSIPRVYNVFMEPRGASTTTYIVQEYIPGTTLDSAFATLTADEHVSIAKEQRDIYSQLALFDGERTRLEPFNAPSWAENLYFYGTQNVLPVGEGEARSTLSFLTYFSDLPAMCDNISDTIPSREKFLTFFDLNRPPSFSHGDLTPWNVIVDKGHECLAVYVVAVVDWAEAGWYPYFWDTVAMERATDRYSRVQGFREMLRSSLLEYFPEGEKFELLWSHRALYLH
ncbi:kinase-like protein [Pilatotrama ljubarskyi]|nr:kinase-like protein [Pilatotrama ljubarskyi]